MKIDEKTKDLVVQFGGMSKVRVNAKSRIRYLTLIKKYFETETKYKFQMLKFEHLKKKSYIGVAGDIEKSKYVICTYYDTPMINLARQIYKPFDQEYLKKHTTINYVGSFLLSFVMLISLYLLFFRRILSRGIINFQYTFVILIIMVLIGLMIRISKNGGIPSRNTLVRNSSSVVTMLKLATDLSNNYQNNVSFILVDYGCQDNFGYHLIKDYFKLESKKMIFLDSVGTGQVTSNMCSLFTMDNPLFENAFCVWGNSIDFGLELDGINEAYNRVIKYIYKCEKKKLPIKE